MIKFKIVFIMLLENLKIFINADSPKTILYVEFNIKYKVVYKTIVHILEQ